MNEPNQTTTTPHFCEAACRLQQTQSDFASLLFELRRKTRRVEEMLQNANRRVGLHAGGCPTCQQEPMPLLGVL